MKTLFKNIKQLVQIRTMDDSFVTGKEMGTLPCLNDAFLLLEGEKILDFGPMEACPKGAFDTIIDATGRLVLPSWCDSHTHLVFAGDREGEFVDKIKGLSYEEIARRGGGILNSAKVLEQTSEEQLFNQSKLRLEEVIGMGTGAIEIKSGYGLSLDNELKMLRVIRRLKETQSIPIRSTFLCAHAIPAAYKNNPKSFVDQVVETWIPAVAKSHLADYIDVFCEKGYFTPEDTERILTAGQQYSLTPKIHVNQFHAIGGVEVGVRHAALSVDHLEVLHAEDIEALRGSKTMPVALPGCSYFLGIPYTPARSLLEAGLPLALASDYNPGSTPSGNMNFVVATACIKMKMTPEEAINAATINGAYAMGLADKVGSITKGKLANLILTKPVSSYVSLPYSFSTDKIERVYLKGRQVKKCTEE